MPKIDGNPQNPMLSLNVCSRYDPGHIKAKLNITAKNKT